MIDKITIYDIRDEIYSIADFTLNNLIKKSNRSVYSEDSYADVSLRLEKLKSLGFCSNPELLEYEKDRTSIKLAEEDLSLVNGFYNVHKDFKIVYKRDLDEICNRYGLEESCSEKYIGQIPSTVLEKISEFFNTQSEFSRVVTVTHHYESGGCKDPYSNVDLVGGYEYYIKLTKFLDGFTDSGDRPNLGYDEIYRDMAGYIICTIGRLSKEFSMKRREIKVYCPKDLLKEGTILNGRLEKRDMVKLVESETVAFVEIGKFAAIIGLW